MEPEIDVTVVASELDNIYKNNPELYIEKVSFFKGAGYKIYRNSTGRHKVEYNGNYVYEAFNGIFRQIFTGS